MPKLRSIFLLLVLTGLRMTLLSQVQANSAEAQDSTEEEAFYKTPFDPQADYQTWGIRARVLPWLLGNAGGLNLLLGAELGFLKNHSIGIDGYYYGDQDHHDHYSGPNDPNNKASDNYNGSNASLFISYNYYHRLRNLRDQMGLSVYTGLQCRTGRGSYNWDRGISKDSVLSSSVRFFSIGPQAGVILDLGEERQFALNLNVAVLNTMKHVSQQSTHELMMSNNTYQFNTWDLRVGVNLYWWFRYGKHTKK